VLGREEELTVTKQPLEENKEEGYKIEAYDFRLGEMTELSDFITLRIPYDTAYCEDGQDPAKCVGAKYRNETTGEWEDVLFEVDTAANELIIYTDHLSTFGAFHVRNEGQRSAYITDIYADFTGIDQQQATKALREYVAGGGADGEEAAGLAAGITYIFSMVTAIAGLAFAGKPHRYRWCRILAYIQLASGGILFVPLLSYAALTLPPLFLLTLLYLFGVGWREKCDFEQQ